MVCGRGGEIQKGQPSERLRRRGMGEVCGVRGVLEDELSKTNVLILSDSQAAIAAVEKAGLGWVKAHNEVHGNEMADQLAKAATMEGYAEAPQITSGGLKQAWKRRREEERRVKGAGMGRVVKWNRKARVMYVPISQLEKVNLQAWRQQKLDKQTTQNAGNVEDMRRQGKHVSRWSVRTEEQIGRRWEDMDGRKRWARNEKDAEGFFFCTVDLVETFFSNIDLH